MENKNTTIRLNKYLSNFGIDARRKIEDFLSANTVTVNGKRVLEPGVRVDPSKDVVLANGKPLQKPKLIYIALNKPKGVISTVSDEHGRESLLDIVKIRDRIYPIGRLDQDSSGLILLTNDGELANRLTHPRFHIPKTYEVIVSGRLVPRQLQILANGVFLKDGKTAPAEVKVLRQTAKGTALHITIHEGKNRQIRRMCGSLGINVLALKRISLGSVRLGDLAVGKYRELSEEEINSLRS